jgi:beta-lactam-binding protein with PASTA domain
MENGMGPPFSAPAGSSADTPAADATPTAGASGIAVTPGKVPNVKGLSLTAAKAAVQEAGFVVKEVHQASAGEKNTVFDQSPTADTTLAAGQTVTLAVSDGPS